MAKYIRHEIVEAVQHDGPPLTVISHKHGEQTARAGDWLVTTDLDDNGEGKKGHVHVIKNHEFKAAGFDPHDDRPALLKHPIGNDLQARTSAVDEDEEDDLEADAIAKAQPDEDEEEEPATEEHPAGRVRKKARK